MASRIYALSNYNRKIGLPALLGSQVLISLILVTVSLTIPSLDRFDLILREGVLAIYIFMVCNVALMLANFLWMGRVYGEVVSRFRERNLPYGSLRGIEAVRQGMRSEIRYVLILLFFVAASLAMYALAVSGLFQLIYGAVGLALITTGFSVVKREYVFDPEQMLMMYQPDSYPLSTKGYTSEIVENFIDPINYSYYHEYRQEATKLLKEDVDPVDTFEKTYFLLYEQSQGSLPQDVVDSETQELFRDKAGWEAFSNHPRFGFTRLSTILTKSKKSIPEFYGLLDRLYVYLSDDLPGFKSAPTYFDAEVTWETHLRKMCHVFAFLHNNTSEPAKLVVKFSAPAFQPQKDEVTIELPPLNFTMPKENKLPQYVSVGEDLVGLIAEVMDNLQVVWFVVNPTEIGTKNVTVSLHTPGGVLVAGRTFTVDVHRDMATLSTRLISWMSVVGGLILPILTILRSIGIIK